MTDSKERFQLRHALIFSSVSPKAADRKQNHFPSKHQETALTNQGAAGLLICAETSKLKWRQR